jgi:hypothetical protein
MKIRSLGAKFLLDGLTFTHTNVTKLIVAFRNFATRLKSELRCPERV